MSCCYGRSNQIHQICLVLIWTPICEYFELIFSILRHHSPSLTLVRVVFVLLLKHSPLVIIEWIFKIIIDLLSNLQMETYRKYFNDSWLTKPSDNISTLQFYIHRQAWNMAQGCHLVELATCFFSLLITSFALVDNYPYWYICCLSENTLWIQLPQISEVHNKQAILLEMNCTKTEH